MPSAKLYNANAEAIGTIELDAEVFGQTANRSLLEQAIVIQLGNRRQAIAHTKTKGEVRGTGKKPFRQKGTGNARQGSQRNPHNPGGGIAFGPRNNRNFEKMMPKKQRRLALFSALSQKFNEGKILALDKYEAAAIKTKNFEAMLHKLPIEKDVLVVLDAKNDLIQKSSKNLPFVKTLFVNYLNISDLQKYDNVLFLESAIKKLSTIFKPQPTKE